MESREHKDQGSKTREVGFGEITLYIFNRAKDPTASKGYIRQFSDDCLIYYHIILCGGYGSNFQPGSEIILLVCSSVYMVVWY